MLEADMDGPSLFRPISKDGMSHNVQNSSGLNHEETRMNHESQNQSQKDTENLSRKVGQNHHANHSEDIMAVKCVRLTTGEEIVAEVTEHDGGYTLGTPANIFMQPDGKGNVNVALMPLFPYAEKKEFVFPKTAVVVVFNPSKALYNEYSRLFGGGLILPTLEVDTKELLKG